MPSVDDTPLEVEIAPNIWMRLHTYWESWGPGYASVEAVVDKGILEDGEVVDYEFDESLGFFEEPADWRHGEFTPEEVVERYGAKFKQAVAEARKKYPAPPGFKPETGGSAKGSLGVSSAFIGGLAMGKVAQELRHQGADIRPVVGPGPGWYGESGRHAKAAREGWQKKVRRAGFGR